MAVHTLEINKDEIVISADSQHPVIEKTIREFSQIIEREIRDTLAVLKRNPLEISERYQLDLPISVRPHIRSVGYIYKDMSLSLNQSRIMTLLMGERLYASPAAAVRELIQNSIDACEARRRLEASAFTPQIEVGVTLDPSGRRWLEVTDNGCGMDEHVLSEYFLKLGNSYYRSPEFGVVVQRAHEDQRPFTPISRFGIGLVSVFLIGDTLEVRTRSTHSPRRDFEGRTVRIEKLGALVFLTPADSAAPGTLVRIRLLPKYNADFENFSADVATYLKGKVVRPHIPVRVSLADSPFTLTGHNGIVFRPDAAERLNSKGLEVVTLDISRWSDSLSGRGTPNLLHGTSSTVAARVYDIATV
jgi:molecular chaperone HtpG